MQNILLFLRGEFIKKKSSGFYWIAVIFGLFFPVAAFVNDLINTPVMQPGIAHNLYEKYFIESAPLITGFFLVILILQNASKIAQLDHKNGGWQLMELLPLQKKSIYFGKFLLLLSSSTLLLLVYFFSGVFLTFIFFLFHEVSTEISKEIPFIFLGIAFLKILIASWLLTVIQYVLSVIIPSYIWALSIGLLGFIISSILNGFGKFQPYNPFHIINHSGSNLRGGDLNNWFLYTEFFSLIFGTILLFIGYWWYINKGIKRAFLKNWKYKMISSATLILLIFGSYLYFTPKKLSEYSKTILAGEITSDYPIHLAYLLHPTMLDTLAEIEIVNGKFRHQFLNELPLTSYNLNFQNYANTTLVMGTLDSIYVDAKFQNGKFEYQIYGNRIAENQFKRTNISWDYTLYQIQEGMNLENYQNLQKSLLEITEEKLQNLKAFRSKDNLTYRDDYKSIVEKEIIVDHLLYKEELTKKVKSVFPEKSILWEVGWDQIEQKVSLNDLQLLDYPKYLDYITIQILKKDTTEVEENIKLLNGFKKFPNGEFKNKIMYHKLMTSLEEANVSEDRDVLITYASEISSKKMQNSLQFLYRNLQKLSKLNPAPNIQATDQKGEPMQLSNLKGKWVIIDFWATWCGPCLYESPYFEKMALKYKNENIAFLALSLDQRKDKWEIEAKNKSKTVLQWHANQINQTKFDYQINGIPRFVMIDPDGNIYQSKMSRPSEAAFEMILRKALGLKDLE